MAWKGRDKNIQADFNQLIQILNNSRIQTENNALYQVIRNMIIAAQQNKNITVEELRNIIEQLVTLNGAVTTINTTISAFQNATFWTKNNETVNLPLSRMVLAGTGITLDYTVGGKVTINSTGAGGGGYWTPLTDGDRDETDLIFAMGDCIAVFVVTP